MRCFVALDLPPAVRTALAAVVRQLAGTGARLRVPPPDQLHVTLKFLGELPAAQATALAAALAGLPLPPLCLQVAGLGRFPPRGAPRVIWAGLGGDLLPLGALAAAVEDRAAVHGVPRETRPLTPHVTLARVPAPTGSRRLLAALGQLAPTVASPPFLAPAMAFYRSDRTAEGSRHTALWRRPLPAPGPAGGG